MLYTVRCLATLSLSACHQVNGARTPQRIMIKIYNDDDDDDDDDNDDRDKLQRRVTVDVVPRSHHHHFL